MKSRRQQVKRLQGKINRLLNKKPANPRPRGWSRNNYKAYVGTQEASKLGNGRASVYLLFTGHEGLYKIGLSTNLAKRLKALSAGNPLAVVVWSQVVPDAAEHERRLHDIFREKRVDREVFRLGAEDRQRFRAYLAEIGC